MKCKKINFSSSTSAVQYDISTFKRWRAGITPTSKAYKQIAQHNKCEVTPEQFVETAHSLGYFREFEREDNEQ